MGLACEPEARAWNNATASQGLLEASHVSRFLTNVTRYLTRGGLKQQGILWDHVSDVSVHDSL